MSNKLDNDIQVHFRHFDRDADGLIDFEEFRLMLREMGFNRRGDVMAHAFRAIDSNSSGHIDLGEFARWWSRQPDPSGEAQSPLAEDSPEP